MDDDDKFMNKFVPLLHTMTIYGSVLKRTQTWSGPSIVESWCVCVV